MVSVWRLRFEPKQWEAVAAIPLDPVGSPQRQPYVTALAVSAQHVMSERQGGVTVVGGSVVVLFS